MKNFKNKVVWIIGASSGIGEALAREISPQGAKVILSARSEDKLTAIAKDLPSESLVAPCDVNDIASLKSALKKGKEKFVTIDSVVFLAAIYDPMEFKNLDIEKTLKIIDINLGGAFNVVNTVLPYMRDKKSGQIALCGSVAGYCGLPKGQPYSATKAAIINMAESLRAEEQDLDIKVICPGFVDTPMTSKNDFDMPMMITPDEAAKALAKGLLKSKFEIRFPSLFTFFVKFLSILPYWLYFQIAKRIEK